MIFLFYFILVVSGLGMIYGLKKYRQGYPWAQSMTVICAVITLAMAFFALTPDRSAQRQIRRHRALHEQYQEIISEKSGRFIAENYENADILVIAPSGYENRPLYKGLLQGIDGRATLNVAIPEFYEEYGDMDIEMLEMEMMDMMGPDIMDQVIENNLRDHELIVSLIDLPYAADRMNLWRQRNKPPMAVISGADYYMELGNLVEYIRNGRIALIIARRPDVEWELERIPRDIDKAFDERYLMVTPDNVERIANEYPEIFERQF